MKKTFASIVSASLLITVAAFAVEKIYSVKTKSDASTGIRFSIPYTGGVHKGSSSEVTSSVVLDENDVLKSANFEVSIGSLNTGNATRDCHMREALGINYSNSRFPEKHVCDSDNQTPATGPDSIAYPKIQIEFIEYQTAPVTPMPVGQTQSTVMKIKVTIHGITKVIENVNVGITKSVSEAGVASYRLQSKFKLSLNDFEVEVKVAKLGPITIGVEDKATVDLDLNVAE